MARPTYDVAVVGAGPAGSAAAIAARRLGLSVLVLESARFPRARDCGGWISPAGIRLCATLGLDKKAASAVEFKGLKLHSWDLKRNVVVSDAALHGWIVDRAGFDAALLAVAARRKAEVLHGVRPSALGLGEDHVELRLNEQRAVAARVVLIADGVLSATARLAHLTEVARMADAARCVHAVLDAPAATPGVEIVLGSGRAAQLVTIVRSKRQTRLTLLTRVASPTALEQFGAFRAAAESTGLIPAAPGAAVSECRSAAGLALDLETHVGKRCLLIGDAGGFVCAFSNEGIYPALRSGCIAAETASRALRARVLQDELTTFGTAWRNELADYLRGPSTDLSLLMPLVFGNAQMAKRVARAFVLGSRF